MGGVIRDLSVRLLQIYSQMKRPLYQTSARPRLPPVFSVVVSKVKNLPSGSRSGAWGDHEFADVVEVALGAGDLFDADAAPFVDELLWG